MLPAESRLTKKKDFDMVFSGGRTVKQGFLLVKVRESGLAHSRFGFVVSKKISSKATVRNKVKRRLRSIVAKHLPGLKKPMDVIFITLPGIEKKEFSEVQETINAIFKKI